MKITTQKTRKMSNTEPTKNWGGTKMLVKGTQFLLHIRHPLCSSYIQSCLVKVLAVIEERKQSTQKVKDPLSFEIWIHRNGEPDRDI